MAVAVKLILIGVLLLLAGCELLAATLRNGYDVPIELSIIYDDHRPPEIIRLAPDQSVGFRENDPTIETVSVKLPSHIESRYSMHISPAAHFHVNFRLGGYDVMPQNF